MRGECPNIIKTTTNKYQRVSEDVFNSAIKLNDEYAKDKNNVYYSAIQDPAPFIVK
jgi:hypothetical protein